MEEEGQKCSGGNCSGIYYLFIFVIVCMCCYGMLWNEGLQLMHLLSETLKSKLPKTLNQTLSSH